MSDRKTKLRLTLFFVFVLMITMSNAQPVDYYNGTEGKSGEELKIVLNEIISNHIDFSYSFAKNIINYADADPENPDHVILFYLQESRPAANYGSGGDYINREHVWAKSHGNFSGKRPMDSDVHNLHPADASVNEDRGNKDFDNIQPQGQQHPEALYCYYTDSTWEPGPQTKGQVARTLLYMATRYEGNHDEIDLELARHNNTYPNPLHGNLDALLEWNRNYPPSKLERRRNERVFESQQNRNPFVDHPEFADFIWGNASPSGVLFSDFQLTPRFPVPGEELTISVTVSGEATITGTSLYWGAEFNSEDHQLSMQATGNTYSVSAIPTGFVAGDMLYLTVKVTTPDSVYSWPSSYRYPRLIGQSDITPIPEVQGTGTASPMVGEEVTIAGRVTANYDFGFYMEANGETFGGMNIYNSLFRGKPGDSIVVRGIVEEYNNLTEIGNVSYVYNFQDNRKVTPKVITTADFSEVYEGMLVSVHHVSFRQGGQEIPEENTSFTLTDQGGTAEMFVASNSRLVGETLPTGFVNVTGILSQYNNTYQLLPRDKNDFFLLTDSPDLHHQLSTVTVYPNPAKNLLQIKTAERVKHIRLYNLKGQLIKQASNLHNCVDVADLTPGMYIIEMVSLTNQTSRSKFVKATP